MRFYIHVHASVHVSILRNLMGAASQATIDLYKACVMRAEGFAAIGTKAV